MTHRHLRAVPTHPDSPSEPSSPTPSPAWLVRVWYATAETSTDDLLAEGVVSTLAEAADYAATTEAAQQRLNGHTWVQALHGHIDNHGRWQRSPGTDFLSLFVEGQLCDWRPATR